MLSLASASSNNTVFDVGSPGLLKFRYTSILSQIEIASWFHNDVEPLFRLLRALLPATYNPYIQHVWVSMVISLPMHTCGLYEVGIKVWRRRNNALTSLRKHEAISI
jgi:hypothetical protein